MIPESRYSSISNHMSSSHVLVATALDGPSVVALFRGAGLSRSLGLPLRLLHVLWEPPEASGGPSPTRAANARAIVVDWAVRLGVDISPDAVDIRAGSRDVEIVRAARTTRPAFLVIGGTGAVESGGPGAVARFVVQHARIPVVVAAPPLPSHRFVAASDMADERYPVLSAAAELAAACASRATAVHAATEATDGDRLERANALGRAIAGMTEYDEGLITTHASVAAGVASVAHVMNADVVVVGIRDGHGATCSALLSSERRTLVAVPLDR